ncbi:MAG: hypothetical protein HY677_00835, partial [Chloroflexi bacterium]|nr:hypothetical protein [Chloroflexota bacterium]
MITELDDLTIHQIPTTMDHVDSGDPRWIDKLWFHVGTTSGEVSVAGHLGAYPNTNTMDGAASVRVGDKQYNARFARELSRDRDRRQVGALSAEIVEHFKAWRFVLAPREGQDISFDIRLESAQQPMEVLAPVFHRQERHIIWNMWHYAQLGRASGSITVAGRNIALKPESAVGARDRSWGVRPIFGQVPRLAPLPESICVRSLWLAGQFDDHSVWLWLMEPQDRKRAGLFGNLSDQTGRTRVDGAMAFGHGDGREQPRVVAAQPKLDLAPDGKSLRGGEIKVTDWDGREMTLSVRPLSTLYSKGLGYGHSQF